MAGSEMAAREWRAAYERVQDLLGGASPAQLATTVPACPAWTVHHLLSHVVGLDADVLTGQEAADHNESWTAAQVDARRDRSTADVLNEWAGMADAVVDYITQVDPRPLGDLITHEQDLRGALGVPGGRDTAGLAAIRDRMAGRLGQAVTDQGLPPLRLEADGWSWASGESEPGAVLRADAYDLMRALTSRRSADELRSWVVAGDIEPYLAAFGGVGTLPAQSLGE